MISLHISADTVTMRTPSAEFAAPYTLNPISLAAMASDPKRYGKTLGKAIFQPLLAPYVAALTAPRENHGLRIEGDENIAWERIFHPEPTWQRAATSHQIYLARTISTAAPITARPATAWQDLRIVTASANPIPDRPIPDYLRTLTPSPRNTVSASAWPDVASLITQAQPHIIQIITHGQNGVLLLGSPDNLTPITADDLAEIAAPTTLIILIACESAEIAPALLRAGCPNVIGIAGLINPHAAFAWTQRLYHELHAHGRIDQAVNASRIALQKRYDWEVTEPILYSRQNAPYIWQSSPQPENQQTIEINATHGAQITISGNITNHHS